MDKFYESRAMEIYCIPPKHLRNMSGRHWVKRTTESAPTVEFWHAGAEGWDFNNGYFWPQHVPSWKYLEPFIGEVPNI